MKFALKIAVALSLAALSTGPASAEWFAHGNYEPDTSYDTGEWIWQGAPGPIKNRIYFAVISGHNLVPISFGKPTVNTNVGAAHTRIETATLEIQHGFLGVWVDCNDDGYIGLAESALREYSAALLSNTARCPAITGTGSWQAGAHNYNGWVSEYIPIVNRLAPTFDTRVYFDPASHVWGDFDRPDQHPMQRNCPTRPLPRGTTTDTGGFLNYVDCRSDLLGPWNFAMESIGDPAGLTFTDEDNARSGAPGQIWVMGPASTDHAAVSTVDCSEEPVLTAQSAEFRAPSPSPGPAASDPSTFSVAGQLNRTYEEWNDDCDTSNDDGREIIEFGIASVEDSDFNSVNPNNKTEANWNFAVAHAQRGAAPFIVPGGPGAGNAGYPQDLGQGIGGTHWLSDSIWTKASPRTVRYDLDSGSVGIDSAYWLTFYAQVGTQTINRGFLLPSTSVGTYGDWACAGADTGILQGWNCDTDRWYRNADGSVPDEIADLAVPGWTYQLRDVDCYDGGVADGTAGVQPAFYGENACF